MRRKRTMLRLTAATLAGLLVSALPVVISARPAAAAGPNLALGKSATASSNTQTYVAANMNDGNQGSYWESNNNAFPQWAQIDLGSATSINQVVLKLPSGWGSRTETLSVQGSTDGTNFSTVVASAGYNFDGSANTVTINFTATSTRYVRLNITANTGQPGGQVSEFEIYGTGGGGSSNLALGKAMSSSGVSQTYVASNANDGNQQTYWESTNNAFPQWLQVDLGTSVSINKIVLKLPTGSWGARTETLSVTSSTDGTNFATLIASAGYAFDGSTNVVTINFGASTTRYVRLNFTANTAWPAGQVSEFEVYGPTTGDTQAPTAPTNLAYTLPQSGQIKLTWNSSSDNVGVTGYDIYLNNALLTSVPSSALSYTDNEPDTLTATYFVRAHDAAGNQSANSNSVTRTGQTGDQQAPTAPTNLAVTTPVSGTVKLTWGASTDNVGVTGYDVFRNGALDTSVGGTTLTYSESQPDTATVMYYVKAHDAAGNQSAASNTVTRTGTGGGGGGTNLAAGRPITGTANTYIYVPANANDNDLTTYFEGSSYPSQVTVQLLGNAQLSSVVVKLNPDAAWGTRTQNIAILGQDQGGGAFVTLAAAANYTFNPATGNSVTIPVGGSYQNIELSIASNTGAPGGQVAEFQVFGTPAPNPDLTVTGTSWTPTSPVETDAITVSTTVKNIGTASSAATNVNVYLGATKVGTTAVGALAAGAQTTINTNIGTQTAGSYALTAKVDESNTVVELNESNNTYTNPTNLVVAPVQSSDLVASSVAWTPSNPSAGNTVSFQVTVKNQGTIASAAGTHNVTLTLLDANNATVKTLNGSFSGALASGASSSPIAMGTWTAVNGKYTVKVVIAVDANELTVKQANNTSNTPLFVGQGANMPYDMYEAEAGTYGGGAVLDGPNRTIGDLGGEASGREAVSLNSTGSFVQWTSRESTNTFVVRFSIPDSSGGGGTSATLDLYANGTLVEPITLNSQFEWLYGDETAPGNSPSAGGPRHIYDEASFMLPSTIASGATIKLQKDSSNSSQYAIDYMNLEQVSPVANPDPTKYLTPTGFDQQSVQAAFDAARQDTTGKLGVYLPAGQYTTSSKFQVYGKAIAVIGAGPWYTQFSTPQTQSNTDAGFSVASTANGSTFTGFAFFGNYTSRIDGPGKVFDITDVSNLTISNIWVEHTVCAIWGTHVTGLNISNLRIRDTFADGINLNNGSQNNTVSNSEARSTGDDSFAIFAAQDHNSSDLTGNVFENLSAILPWRAATFAIYGGDGNTFENLYSADTLDYSGLTLSSLNFGFPFQGFGSTPKTVVSNVSLVRDGGHFWGGQVFGAVWVFSATQPFQGIRVSDLTVTNPTYSGIMFQTDYSGGTALNPVQDTIFTITVN